MKLPFSRRPSNNADRGCSLVRSGSGTSVVSAFFSSARRSVRILLAPFFLNSLLFTESILEDRSDAKVTGLSYPIPAISCFGRTQEAFWIIDLIFRLFAGLSPANEQSVDSDYTPSLRRRFLRHEVLKKLLFLIFTCLLPFLTPLPPTYRCEPSSNTLQIERDLLANSRSRTSPLVTSSWTSDKAREREKFEVRFSKDRDWSTSASSIECHVIFGPPPRRPDLQACVRWSAPDVTWPSSVRLVRLPTMATGSMTPPVHNLQPPLDWIQSFGLLCNPQGFAQTALRNIAAEKKRLNFFLVDLWINMNWLLSGKIWYLTG